MSLEWWQKSIIYHIYLPAFKDGNNDGIGDFKGLISKLGYFEELKISSLLLSPFYPSPMKDNGYDISSFTEVDPMYGCMDDFDELMREIRNRGMNIIIDFVANHTSNQHPWFEKSVLREYPFSDYYIWVDPLPESTENAPLPPNNWLSVFDGSAWTWNEDRKQFYFHQFLPEQPDLNYHNPCVREEMKNVLRFWLDKGVDGFRIDAASHLFEDEMLLDEPLSENPRAKKGEYKYLNHIYTKGNEKNLDLLEEWKQEVLTEYTERTGKPKIMLVEAIEEIEEVMLYYGTFERKLADIPMNFQFYKVKRESTGKDLHKLIDSWLSKMPKGKYPNWVMSSHDDPRVVSRVGSILASSLHMVMMLLPGTPIWYYGDELGMENGVIFLEDMKDSFALRTVPSNSRDPMRTPMHWNGGKNAGFTDFDTPWLPVNPSYKLKNVEVEKRDPISFLSNFKKLLAIRNEPSILFSTLEYPIVNEKIFSILRSMIGSKCYLLVLNMSSKSISVDMTSVSDALPAEANLELTNCEKYYDLESSLVSKVNHLGDVNTIECASAEAESSPCVSEDLMYACASPNTGYPFEGSACAISAPSTSHENQNDISVSWREIIKVPLNNVYLEPHQAIVLSFIG